MRNVYSKILIVFILFAFLSIVAVSQEEVKYTPLKEISNNIVGEDISIKAKINTVIKPEPTSKRPFKFNISDESGSSVMFMWRDKFEEFGDENALKKGDSFTAKVTVTEYNNKFELRLNRASDIKITKAEEPKATPGAVTEVKEMKKEEKKEGDYTKIGSINKDSLGETVKVKGIFTSVRKPWNERAPYICMLKDDTGTVQVVFWSDVFDALEVKVEELKNAEVEVNSILNEYQGTIQIKVNHPDNIKILKKSTPEKSPEPKTTN